MSSKIALGTQIMIATLARSLSACGKGCSSRRLHASSADRSCEERLKLRAAEAHRVIHVASGRFDRVLVDEQYVDVVPKVRRRAEPMRSNEERQAMRLFLRSWVTPRAASAARRSAAVRGPPASASISSDIDARSLSLAFSFSTAAMYPQ